MEKQFTKKDIKFFKALLFWEYRTRVLEYYDLEDYALTVFYKDHKTVLLGATLTNLDDEFEFRQFADWIFVICKKYKKKFISLERKVNPETGRRQFIDLYIA